MPPGLLSVMLHTVCQGMGTLRMETTLLPLLRLALRSAPNIAVEYGAAKTVVDMPGRSMEIQQG